MQVKRSFTHNEATGVQTGKQHCCSQPKGHTLRPTNQVITYKKQVKIGTNTSLIVEVFVTFFGGGGVLKLECKKRVLM